MLKKHIINSIQVREKLGPYRFNTELQSYVSKVFLGFTCTSVLIG